MRRSVESTLHLRANRKEVFSILRDYDRFRRWLPQVTGSRTLVREGDIAVAEFQAPRFGHRKLVMELVETPPESIAFAQADRFDGRGVSGRLDLLETKSEQGVLLRARVSACVPFYDFGASRRLERLLQDSLKALSRLASHLGSLDGDGEREERKKILEVVRRPGSIELWYQGETFTLTARPGNEES